ncbi:MAG: hypothetical protein ACKPKO_29395, partial [Candidatus Fonsibacter sp.]
MAVKAVVGALRAPINDARRPPTTARWDGVVQSHLLVVHAPLLVIVVVDQAVNLSKIELRCPTFSDNSSHRTARSGKRSL